ncbi:MAG: enoyl-CoA hydratase [Hyphomicrobiaceae bacterium]
MTDPAVHTSYEEDHEGACVARVVVDNQTRLNCLSTTQVVRLAEAFQTISGRGDVRAVVLTGAGEKAFIGGADLNELGGLCADSARLYITRLHQTCAAIRRCPVPVIARVNGYCLGAGLEVAASCDMRAASENAVFGMPEVHMGLPSVIEAALLPGQIGWGRTRELLLTGETFPASEAMTMGFIQKVVPLGKLDDAVGSWLSAICRAAPQAVRSQKALIDRWQRVSVEEGVMAGIDALSDAYTTGEPQQRIAAFFAAKGSKS